MPLSKFSEYIYIYLFVRVCSFCNEKHRALLTTCEHAIAPGGCVLVFYTHHRPHLAQRDMDFFGMARKTGWECEKVLTERFPVRLSLGSPRVFLGFAFALFLNRVIIILSSFYLFIYSQCFRRTRARRKCGRQCMAGSSCEHDSCESYL